MVASCLASAHLLATSRGLHFCANAHLRAFVDARLTKERRSGKSGLFLLGVFMTGCPHDSSLSASFVPVTDIRLFGLSWASKACCSRVSSPHLATSGPFTGGVVLAGLRLSFGAPYHSAQNATASSPSICSMAGGALLIGVICTSPANSAGDASTPSSSAGVLLWGGI